MKISELPEEVKLKALLRQEEPTNKLYYNKTTDELHSAFCWEDTTEGHKYWSDWNQKELESEKEPNYYDNSNGSLYKFCEDHDLNTYEFDILKRVMRCRKKGMFMEDLEKTKFLIDLYIKEMKEDEK
jgi:hypothetical protein